MDAVSLCLSLALSIALPHAVVRWDEKQVTTDRRRWVWNNASHWSAIVAFSWLAVIVHFWRTRRSVLGVVLGVVVASLGLCVQGLLVSAVSWLLSA